jgi:hypothetical protein
MTVLSPDYLRALHDSYATLSGRLLPLFEAYAFFRYKTEAGLQCATHGFLRRLNTMHHCTERIFEILPPELDEKPVDAVLYDATVFIQSFVMNTFGALDNLAWIWVSEKPLKLNRNKIGLGPQCKQIRSSFSQETRDYLTAHDQWFDDIIDFRDALAHRISLYIPPFIVSTRDEAAHKSLEARKWATKDNDEIERLSAEQRKMEAFHPVMKHALDDNKPPVFFHLRMVDDFRTVVDISERVMGELKRL